MIPQGTKRYTRQQSVVIIASHECIALISPYTITMEIKRTEHPIRHSNPTSIALNLPTLKLVSWTGDNPRDSSECSYLLGYYSNTIISSHTALQTTQSHSKRHAPEVVVGYIPSLQSMQHGVLGLIAWLGSPAEEPRGWGVVDHHGRECDMIAIVLNQRGTSSLWTYHPLLYCCLWPPKVH